MADTGVDSTHPALSSRVIAAKDFVPSDSDGNNSDDLHGHGTHVSGTVASTDATYKGIAYGANIINLKIGNSNIGYSAYDSDVMTGVDWAIFGTTDPAEIISHSYSGTTGKSRFFDAVVDDLGLTVSVSAGNDGPTPETVGYDSYNSIVVGAMYDMDTISRADDTIASYSSRGPVPGTSRIKPDIMAPGSNIKSAAYNWEGANPDFVNMSGTSMAAPHISGAAALLMSAGVYDPKEIKALLINTAEDKGTSGGDYDYGWGYVDLDHAFFHTPDVRLGIVNTTNRYLLYKGYGFSGDKASLVWNRHVTYAGASYPITYYSLSDLDLYLYNESDGTLISYSDSGDENVEQVISDTNTNTVLQVYVYSFASGISSEQFALASEEGFSATSLPNLRLDISNPSIVGPNKNFNISINVTNLGDVSAHNGNVTLSLPSGFTIISSPNYYVCLYRSLCNLGSIAAGNRKNATWTISSSSIGGSYSLNANVNSLSYGETITASNSSSVLVDVTPPVIVANPTRYESSFSAAKNGSRITVNATISDNISPVKNATVDAFPINSSLVYPVVLMNVGGYWINDSIVVTASDGVYLLNVTTYDNADNANVSAQITVKVDNTPPIINTAQINYQTGFTAAKNGSTLTLNASVSDALAGIKNVTVNASQTNSSLGDIVLTNNSGFWNTSVIVNTSDGTYNLNITAYDNAGNVNDTSQITVIVDNTPPDVTVYPVSYQRGSAANNRSIIGFNASADDPLINSTSAGLKNASVNVSLINNTGRIELTSQSGFWKGNATFDKFIADGNYSMNITFFDYAGNKNDSMQINISIDNTPPSVTEVSLTSLIEVGGFNNITANITDAFGINTSEVYLHVTYPNATAINYNMSLSGAPPASAQVEGVVGGGGSGGGGGGYGYLVYFNFTDTMQYGRYNITIIANDTTGNTNNTEKTWFVTTKYSSSVVLIHGGGRGETAYGPNIWNRSNFTGLVAEETLNVQNVSGRTIPQMNLWYNTTKQIVQYKVNEANSSLTVEQGLDINGMEVSQGGYYAKIGWQGIPYVAFNGKANKISRLILEQGLSDSKTLAVKEIWDMGDGFSLKLQSTDTRALPKQAWLTLYKNGTWLLDDKVVAESAVYTFVNSTAGESNVPIFVTYADNISATSIRLKYTWLISDNVNQFRSGDDFGIMRVSSTSDSSNNLTNEVTEISLSQDSTTNLMDDLYFRVTSNASLEYYPFFTVASSVINASNSTDVDLEILTNSSVAGSFKITKMTDVPAGMNRSFGLTPFGKYISIDSNVADIINWVVIKIYYTEDELSASGLDENSLRVSWHDENSNSWELLAKGSPSWVNDAGVNTANINNYSGYVWANISHLSTFAVLGTPTVTTTTTTSSSGGGGGGGGGGVSGENASNIIVKEKYDLHIYKDKTTSYRFTNASNPVKFVNITGRISAGEINVAVEVLRGTSTLVNISPPGNIYKNINIWVGTSGFAVPRNIQKATVEFSVDRNWITENSITSINLLRYDTAIKEWFALSTDKIGENATDEYYVGETDRFSPFAIAGVKSSSSAALIQAPPALPPLPPAKETAIVKSTQASESSNAPYWTLTLILFVVVVVLAVYIKLKRR